jgi:hypothetical protein
VGTPKPANADGTQEIEDTGPLTRKRMEAIRGRDHRRRPRPHRPQAWRATPFFLWLNTTHMHFRTHTTPTSRGQAGACQSSYHDTMLDGRR